MTLRLFSPVRSTSQEALRQEVVAAEAALEQMAQVDGLPVVYDSPAVSIALRKVSAEALVLNGSEIEAPDGASIKIPADPRVKGRHGTPVTVSVTSYHAGDSINKDMPRIKFNGSNETNASDRVDFFMTRTSVTWRGTVDVKVPGLSAQVPAHDRPWTPYGEEASYAEEKAQVCLAYKVFLGS